MVKFARVNYLFVYVSSGLYSADFYQALSTYLRRLQVSNLFARDELDEITQELIPVMKKEFPRLPPTPDNLYNYFISRARNNLHVVLCFSPVSTTNCSYI